MEEKTIQTTWEIPPKQPALCTIESHVYSESEKLMKAARSGVLLLALAIGTIFIPIVHFFAPPILLTLAVVLTLRNLNLHEALIYSSGTCGSCGEQIKTELGKVKPVYPIWTSCPHCNERLRILEPENKLPRA